MNTTRTLSHKLHVYLKVILTFKYGCYEFCIRVFLKRNEKYIYIILLIFKYSILTKMADDVFSEF